jgi:hypothetical protein
MNQIREAVLSILEGIQGSRHFKQGDCQGKGLSGRTAPITTKARTNPPETSIGL